MRKCLLKLFLVLLCGAWTTHASAYWEKSYEPITDPSELKAGMFITLVNVNSEAASLKILSAPNLGYASYESISAANVFELVDAGTNEWTGEQMYFLRSVSEDKYLGSGDVFDASMEDAVAITFGNGNVWCGVPDWGTAMPGPDDEPNFPSDKIPQWDWLNGNCLVVFEYTSESTARALRHVWGWDSYTTANFQSVNLVEGERITSTAPWYAYEATYVDSPIDDLNEIYTRLMTANYTEKLYVPGTTFGSVDSTVVQAYNAALEQANEVLLNSLSTDDEARAAITLLEEAEANLLAGVILPEDGHYYYIYLTDPSFEQQQGQKRAWYMDRSYDAVRWGPLDTDDISYLFKLEKQADGSFAIRSVMDDRYLSGATSVSTTPTTTQSFFPSGYGNFYIINGTAPSTGGRDVYHADGHGNGAGVSGPLKIWEQKGGLGTSDWNFLELTDLSRIDEMRKVYAQKMITEDFENELAQARADSAAGYITKFYITNANQLSTNAPESAEGALGNLLDDNYTTYFHSSYNTRIGEPHYLQVALPEALNEVAVYWKKRSQNNNNRPTQITVLGSNDGENFTELCVMPTAPDTLPTAASQTDYYSKAISLGAAYSYLRFRVDSTNNNALDPEDPDNPDLPRYPFFTFSEFNLSDAGFPTDPNSMALREDMIPAYAALKAAIDEALAKDPAQVTQSDVDALKAANAAFAAAYPDTTALSSAISRALRYASGAIVLQPGSAETMGMCQDESTVTALREKAESIRAALDANPKMTRAEIDTQTAELAAAEDAFLATIVTPEPGKWYYIQSRATSTSYEAYNALVYPNTTSVGSGLRWGGTAGEEGVTSPKYLWQFIATETPGEYYVQNVGSGFYLGECRGTSQQFLLSDTAVAYNITYVSGGQLTLTQAVAGALPIHANSSNNIVGWTASANNGSVWTFVENSDEQCAIITVSNNWADVICLPYDVTGEFYAFSDETGEEATPVAYEITGARYDADGNVTEIGLSEMEVDGAIPAGTPFLLIIGDPANSEKVDMQLDLGLILGSEIVNEPKNTGAMIGVLTNTAIDAGCGYFSGTGLVVNETQGTVISTQTGYIDARLLQGATGESTLYLPVNGGTLTDIQQAVSDALGTKAVNVCTLDGRIIRTNVAPANALKGLAKGIYIVGGRKVTVE